LRPKGSAAPLAIATAMAVAVSDLPVAQSAKIWVGSPS
jgi:hypothetical protein